MFGAKALDHTLLMSEVGAPCCLPTCLQHTGLNNDPYYFEVCLKRTLLYTS